MFHGSTQPMEPLDNSEEGFVAMGTYQIWDAQKLLEAFELKGIEFRAEFDDGITDVSNRYGIEAHATVCVRAEQRQLADNVYFELFGDFLPNYDSPFFDDPENVQENPEGDV